MKILVVDAGGMHAKILATGEPLVDAAAAASLERR
jgi:hypothetical protein